MGHEPKRSNLEVRHPDVAAVKDKHGARCGSSSASYVFRSQVLVNTTCKAFHMSFPNPKHKATRCSQPTKSTCQKYFAKNPDVLTESSCLHPKLCRSADLQCAGGGFRAPSRGPAPNHLCPARPRGLPSDLLGRDLIQRGSNRRGRSREAPPIGRTRQRRQRMESRSQCKTE